MKKRYFIGKGTSTVEEFATKQALDKYFDKMKDIDRHFCRVYDTEKHTDVPGWKYQYDHQI